MDTMPFPIRAPTPTVVQLKHAVACSMRGAPRSQSASVGALSDARRHAAAALLGAVARVGDANPGMQMAFVSYLTMTTGSGNLDRVSGDTDTDRLGLAIATTDATKL